MTQQKPTDPASRMGIYKVIDTVPDRHLLDQYSDRYEGYDVWSEWADQATAKHTSERFANLVERTERSWKQHMNDQGRHHALANPIDVDTWSRTILTRCQPLSAYQIYFTKLESFYEWLQFHTDHPHLYHPVWMAAANFEATATIWDAKMDRRDE